MATTFTHVPSALSFVLDRDPSIGNVSRRSLEQDELASDSGKAFIRTRKVPKLSLELTFEALPHQMQSDLEAFYFLILKESQETFTLKAIPIIADAIQAGDTIRGELIIAGQNLKCVPNEVGVPLEAGRFYRVQDFINLTNCRIVRASFRNTDVLRKATSVSFSILQELDPIP